ncbi:twin-arginine translocation pathway signal [Mycolicibacterium arenosum]|uniref:Twin-arginine translocation pathway signal n=1 Tax=Mycolicibacterium arenosum TaxID=2952157 RepID=A0ABT1M2H3_9MYCO|nr:twin-arginine translocation pathway signal [Mycolicibacterium sp. CAU 1645]MCP9273354.1 twin-arginine translocation pathway signal [Mycolicibacterium sp. CAU 1645]
MTEDNDTLTTDVDDTAAVDEDTVQNADEGTAATGRSSRRLILPIALAVALLASAALAAWFYFATYQPDQKVDQAVAARVIQSASDGAVALLSYTPETLDEDFTAAKSKLTGEFLNYYTRFTQEIVTPAAKQKSVKTLAVVVRSALSNLEPTKAQVLLFINQQTVSKENPDGSFTASSVKVELTKVGNDWLISSFDPV